ncbi:MAG: DUF1697 domain-containing protein [Ignavibacteria bacterium]|jgi:uncharacterized protein (DUF1697 family)
MKKYVAFLRGVNVSGHRIIKMEDLRKIFSSMGFDAVTTFIQSGNVLFKSNEKDKKKITNKIESQLKKELGYDVTVMLRTNSELKKIINSNPFLVKGNDTRFKFYITFLQSKPSAEVKARIKQIQSEIQDSKIIGTEIYTAFERSKSKHPFSNNQVEKLLKQRATTRNFSVVNKILAMDEQQ